MFTEEDIHLLLQSLTASNKLLPENSVIVKSLDDSTILSSIYIQTEIAAYLNEIEGRTNSSDIAAHLNVEPKVVEQSLIGFDRDWFGVVGLQIISRREFERILAQLKNDLETEIVQVLPFCRKHGISREIFGKLLAYSPGNLHWEWLGPDQSLIYSKNFYSTKEEEVENELKSRTEPADISNFFSLPDAFISRIINSLLRESQLQGTLNGSIYTPLNFKHAQQEELISKLSKEGIISFKDVKRSGVEKPEAFVTSKIEARLLKAHFVSEEYLQRLFSSAKTSLETEGFCEIKDDTSRLTPEEEHGLRKMFRSTCETKPLEYEDVMVAPILVTTISKEAAAFAKTQAHSAWDSHIKKAQQSLDKHLNFHNLFQFLSSQHPFIPNKALKAITISVHSKVSTTYESEIRNMRDSVNGAAKLHFTDKYLIRFQVHVQGVQDLEDASLRGKIGNDLVDYYRSQFFEGFDKLKERIIDEPSQVQTIKQTKGSIDEVLGDKAYNADKKLFRMSEILEELMRDIKAELPTPEIVSMKRREMISELQKQAEKASDTSLLLLLSTIIIHAKIKDRGVIRATGKYVPKLVKTLKGKIGEEDFDHLVKVKDAVIGKVEITTEDIERLKTMTDQ